MSRLTRDGTAEPVSRDQILRHARGQGNVHFPCSADYEQDWQPYPVDPYSAICDDHTYIHKMARAGCYKRPKRKVETLCVAFLLCDPGWYVHKPDVENKWDDNTHRHTSPLGRINASGIE